MICEYFGKCGSCSLYKLDYKEQLEYKKKYIQEIFNLKNIDIIYSKSSYFRNRAEFKVYHEKGSISYAMFGYKKGEIVKIKDCKIIHKNIYNLMPILLQEIKKNSILKERIFSIEFLSSTTNEILITLIYHKKIDHLWKIEAKKLAQKLNIDLIGRSRGVKIVVTKDYIDERLNILKKYYYYRLYDSGFIQPNSKVNEKMIGWIKTKMVKQDHDLLELYCGHGNFTIPLSENFNKVLATEISKRSIKTAIENCNLNNKNNIFFARLSSQEISMALKKERSFNRLKNIDLDSFDLKTVFVDPPRAGLDDITLDFIKSKFKTIIYISCNPDSLKRDLKLLKEYKIKDFTIFDQFCHTKHIECGVILEKLN